MLENLPGKVVQAGARSWTERPARGAMPRLRERKSLILQGFHDPHEEAVHHAAMHAGTWRMRSMRRFARGLDHDARKGNDAPLQANNGNRTGGEVVGIEDAEWKTPFPLPDGPTANCRIRPQLIRGTRSRLPGANHSNVRPSRSARLIERRNFSHVPPASRSGRRSTTAVHPASKPGDASRRRSAGNRLKPW